MVSGGRLGYWIWGVFAFLIPLVGLAFAYILRRSKRPDHQRVGAIAFKAAIAGFALHAIGYLLKAFYP
jgi:hypothetical protein